MIEHFITILNVSQDSTRLIQILRVHIYMGKKFFVLYVQYQSQLTFFRTNFNRFLWKMDETK